MSPPQVPRHILPVLVTAQFAGTSLWFAVNAVMPDLQRELGWPASAVGPLTSALQAVGSVLTLSNSNSNSIGFGISIVSILLFVSLSQTASLGALLPWLAVGPALGLCAMTRLIREKM